MNTNSIIKIGFDEEPKFIDVSDMFLKLNDENVLSLNNRYNQTRLIQYKEKRFIYSILGSENFGNKNNLFATLTLYNLPKGQYKLSFTMICGFDGINISFNDKLQNDKSNLKIIFNSKNFDIKEKQIYNVFTTLRNAKSDIVNNNNFYINISDIESVYNFSNFYKYNFLFTLDFFSKGDENTLKFYHSSTTPNVDFSNCQIYLSDLKLEYMG
jgi:hypothetical protein